MTTYATLDIIFLTLAKTMSAAMCSATSASFPVWPAQQPTIDQYEESNHTNGTQHEHEHEQGSARFKTINLNFHPQAPWPAWKESAVASPYTYIATNPGKELRSLLLDALNIWLAVPPASLEIITNIIRMLHTASLLIDDIQDGSELRRGASCGAPCFWDTADH